MPRSRGRLAVALGVGRGEVLARRSRPGRRGAGAGGVGEHRARFNQDSAHPADALGQQRAPPDAGRAAVVTLRFSLGAAHDRARCPRRAPPARPRRWPRASSSRARASARSSAARRNTCGVCTAHSSRAVERLADDAGRRSAALDRVGDRRGRDRRVELGVALERGEHRSRQRRRHQRAGGVVDQHRLAGAGRPPAPRAPTPSGTSPPRTPYAPGRRSAPGGSATTISRDRGDARAARRCSTASSAARRAARAPSAGRPRDAPRCRQRRSARPPSSLGHSRTRQSGRCRVRESLATSRRPSPSAGWPSPRAARRGTPRPLPRPCRARTSAPRRGSSWRA